MINNVSSLKQTQRSRNKRFLLSFGHVIPILTVSLTIGVIFLHLRSDVPLWRLMFILFLVGERIYETFYTSKEREGQKLHRDWALLVVIISYLAVFQGSFYEYYLVRRNINSNIFSAALTAYFISLAIRWWTIQVTGDQWGIHSVEQARVSVSRRLIREGPYRFLRHPYYLAVCIEIISIPIMMGALWALMIAVFIVCPAEIYRGYLEEKGLLATFGWSYLKYKQERAGFLPIKKAGNYDRRQSALSISFKDRRGY